MRRVDGMKALVLTQGDLAGAGKPVTQAERFGWAARGQPRPYYPPAAVGGEGPNIKEEVYR